MKVSIFAVFLCFIMISTIPQVTFALPIYGVEGTETVGNFSGEITYNSTTENTAILTIELTNISDPPANGGYITGFAFNNPGGITSVDLAPVPYFELLGDPLTPNSIAGPPFGDFDLGAAIGNKLNSGGKVQNGIGVGDTETFTFTLSGTGLDSLSDQDFLEALSENPGGGGGQFLVVRFRGFNDGSSNKIPAGTTPVPEPATMLLVGVGLVGLAGIGRRKFLKKS